MTQAWWCEKCGSRGAVFIKDGTGVWEAMTQIRDDHHRNDGECADHFGVMHVRVSTESVPSDWTGTK